uniref:Secreted protein n=1 Tax=Mesocestoides corti TaxID=53468 RepID=A0A5K3FZA9_MESCO
MHLPSVSTTLATPLTIYCSSFMSFSGWLPIFLACHWNAKPIRHQNQVSGPVHPSPPHRL